MSLPSIPRYDLVEEVGSGGMSVVYRARDTTLDREVAVKVLHRHLAGKESERKRFRREAQAVARLAHPNILEIHDYSGEETEEAWIVSEFIRGPTVREFSEQTGFGLPEIGAMVAERVAAALVHAHSIGIIHRDVKPENVMIQDDGTIKLADFGIAQMVDRDERMTMTGALLGSPAHMAPETIEGKGGSEQSDVFSLGTVLYWLCCGALPFRGNSPAEVLRRIVVGEWADPRTLDPRVSDELCAIVRRAMARDPADRYESAQALQDALVSYLKGHGLERPEEELRLFFAAPDTYKESLRQSLVTLLLQRAETAAGHDDPIGAIASCDRVLALSPGHERATEILASVRRSRDLRQAVVVVGALGAVAAMMVAIALAWPDPVAQPVSVTRQDPPVVQPPAEAGPKETAPENVEPVEPTPAKAQPRVVLPPKRIAVVKTTRRVQIQVRPYGHIEIDGKHLANSVKADAVLRVGSHRLRIHRVGFVPVEATIKVSGGRGPLEFKYLLEPRPATIRVINDQGAVIVVGDKVIGTADGEGREVPIAFTKGDDGRYVIEQQVTIRLQRVGFKTYVETITVRAGQQRELRVSLEPES